MEERGGGRGTGDEGAVRKAILNYTGVESEVNYTNSAGQLVKADLAGLSDSSYNATLYFDNKTFSARISAAYRSEYLTTVPGRDRNDVWTGFGPTNVLIHKISITAGADPDTAIALGERLDTSQGRAETRGFGRGWSDGRRHRRRW